MIHEWFAPFLVLMFILDPTPDRKKWTPQSQMLVVVDSFPYSGRFVLVLDELLSILSICQSNSPFRLNSPFRFQSLLIHIASVRFSFDDDV
jgi:hypothetical protein